MPLERFLQSPEAQGANSPAGGAAAQSPHFVHTTYTNDQNKIRAGGYDEIYPIENIYHLRHNMPFILRSRKTRCYNNHGAVLLT